MFNLIKADFFRFRKSTTFRNLIVFYIVVVIIMTVVFFYGTSASIMTFPIGDKMAGFFIKDIFDARNYLDIFKSALGLTIFMSITMLFIITDMAISRYKLGTIKNTIAYGHSRYKIYFSNLLATIGSISAIYISLILVCTIVWSIMASISGINININLDSIIITLKSIGILILMLWAMASFYTMISTLLKNKTVVVVFGIMMMSFIPVFIMSKLSEEMMNKIPYFVVMFICSNPDKTWLVWTYILSAVIMISITSMIGCLIFNKQEIK